jgi:hypothetical protein
MNEQRTRDDLLIAIARNGYALWIDFAITQPARETDDG